MRAGDHYLHLNNEDYDIKTQSVVYKWYALYIELFLRTRFDHLCNIPQQNYQQHMSRKGVLCS